MDEILGTGIVFNGGSAGNLLTLQSTGDFVRLNGAVTLQTDVVLDTDLHDANDQGGDVTFTRAGTVDSQASEANDLAIDAGSDSVFFNADIGAGTNGQLGHLVVSEADGGVTFGESDTDQGAGSTSFVTTINVVGDGAETDGLVGVELGSGVAAAQSYCIEANANVESIAA